MIRILEGKRWVLFFLKRPVHAVFRHSAPKLIKNKKFRKMYFLLFSFVTLSLLAKIYVSINKIVNFGPFGPFCYF